MRKIIKYKYTYIHSWIYDKKTLSISEGAYNRINALKTSKKESFSDVILKYYPKRKKLSNLFCEISPIPELAYVIENASKSMRKFV